MNISILERPERLTGQEGVEELLVTLDEDDEGDEDDDDDDLRSVDGVRYPVRCMRDPDQTILNNVSRIESRNIGRL